jgi:hypothetical protein
LEANVIADPLALIAARVKFIITKQQRIDPGNPLDGAYLAYDNETDQQVLDKEADHDEARERVGMGVLVALCLPLCKDPEWKQQLLASVEKYETFIEREIQDTNGVVYNRAGYQETYRRYNSPRVAHLRLAMYWATHDRKYLDLYVRTIRAYYGKKRAQFGQNRFICNLFGYLHNTSNMASDSRSSHGASRSESALVFCNSTFSKWIPFLGILVSCCWKVPAEMPANSPA